LYLINFEYNVTSFWIAEVEKKNRI